MIRFVLILLMKILMMFSLLRMLTISAFPPLWRACLMINFGFSTHSPTSFAMFEFVFWNAKGAGSE